MLHGASGGFLLRKFAQSSTTASGSGPAASAAHNCHHHPRYVQGASAAAGSASPSPSQPAPFSTPPALPDNFRTSSAARSTPRQPSRPPQLMNRHLRLAPLDTVLSFVDHHFRAVDLWLSRAVDDQPLLPFLVPAASASVAALGGHLYSLLFSGAPAWLEGLLHTDLLVFGGTLALWGCAAALAGWHLRVWLAATLLVHGPSDSVRRPAASAAPSAVPYAIAAWRLACLHAAAVVLTSFSLSPASLALGVAAFAGSLLPAALPAVRSSLQVGQAAAALPALLLVLSDAALLVLLTLATHAADVAADAAADAEAAFLALGTAAPAVAASGLAVAATCAAAAVFTAAVIAITQAPYFQARLDSWRVEVGDEASFHLTLRMPGTGGAVVDTTRGLRPLRMVVTELPLAAEEDEEKEEEAEAAVGVEAAAAAASSPSSSSVTAEDASTSAAAEGPEVGPSSQSAAGAQSQGAEEEASTSAAGLGSSGASSSGGAGGVDDVRSQHGGRFAVFEDVVNALLLGGTVGEVTSLPLINPLHGGYTNPDLHWFQPRASFVAKFRDAPAEPDIGDVFMYSLGGSGASAHLIPVRVAAMGDMFVELDGNAGVRGQQLLLEVEVVGVHRPAGAAPMVSA